MRKNMAFTPFFLLISCLFQGVVHAEGNDDNSFIKAACNEAKPLVYQENGIIKGPGYKIAMGVLEHSNIPFSYEIQPWARVYLGGVSEKNFLVGCLGRTAKREHLFHWVGPISKEMRVAIYKLAINPIKISNLEQTKQYAIGAIRGSYDQDFLEESNFNKNNIYLMMRPDQLLKMLIQKKYELIISNDSIITSISKKLNIAPSTFEKVAFAFGVTENLAFSKNTSPELVKKLRASYQTLEAEGAFKELLK